MYFARVLLMLVQILFISLVCAYPQIQETKPEFTFYSREDWGAKPSTDSKLLKTPVPYVVIHHTYLPAACNTSDACGAAMRSMQDYHMSKDWGDIGYNFCVGSEGGAYEGRGWQTVGIHAGAANSYSIGICLIGDWRVDEPPSQMLETTKNLINVGVKKGIISPTYTLKGHNQIMSTECPGTRLFNIIASWDHFSSGKFSASKP